MLKTTVCTQRYVHVPPIPPQLSYRPRDVHTQYAGGKCPQRRHNRDADRQTPGGAHNDHRRIVFYQCTRTYIYFTRTMTPNKI